MEPVICSTLSRYHKLKEKVQKFEVEITPIEEANPSLRLLMQEILAIIERFLDGLHEGTTQQEVMLACPKTLKHTLLKAMEFEVVKQLVRSPACV